MTFRRAWWRELGVALVVFCWRQPFRSQSMPDWLPSTPTGQRGVVLVHGFVCNRGLWLPWLQQLRAAGHACVAVNLEPVFGSIDDYPPLVEDAVRRVTEATGMAPLLIGHSMGGLAIRAWLRAYQSDARMHHAITLGTPFTGHPKATNAWRFYQWVSGQQAHDEDLLAEVRKPPPVPTTSIYSKSDGIVAWRCSLNPARHAHTENIQLHSSHIGMGMNPMALYAIADRLRQDPARWKRFDAQGARRWFYKVAHQPETLTQWY